MTKKESLLEEAKKLKEAGKLTEEFTDQNTIAELEEMIKKVTIDQTPPGETQSQEAPAPEIKKEYKTVVGSAECEKLQKEDWIVESINPTAEGLKYSLYKIVE